MVRTRAQIVMDRHRLETLTLPQIREEARLRGLILPDDVTRNGGIKLILDFAERNAAVGEQVEHTDSSTRAGRSEEIESVGESPSQPQQVSNESLLQFCATLSVQLQQQQEMLQQMVAAVRDGQSMSVPNTSGRADTRLNGISRAPSEGGQTSSLGSVSSAQAVNLLATQIPEFSGAEGEIIEVWLRRINKVAEIHVASDGVKYLAATSKLKGAARKWFEMGSGEMLESWQGFSEAIEKRFRRKILFHVAIQKVEARRWNFTKESFLEYAAEKLALMYGLDLPVRETIHLIVGGIGSRSLRETAAALGAEDVDLFLQQMQSIISASGEMEIRKQSRGHLSKPPKKDHEKEVSREITCFHCKVKGHKRYECPKLTREEQKPAWRRAPVMPAVSVVQEDDEEKPSTMVALVSGNSGRQIYYSGKPLTVISLNSNPCKLTALVDTGSPISFVRENIYKKYLKNSAEALAKITTAYRALNNTPIQISGITRSTIILEQLPDTSLEIKLHVLRESSISIDIVIGRDFLENQNIDLLYSPTEKNKEEMFMLLRSLPQEAICSTSETLNEIIDNIEIDFDNQAKSELKSLIKNINDKIVPILDNDYSVKVTLKDSSTYAYAPRRFAWSERNQIRKITDDLLAHGIIKTSTSPYCARVVPVSKKNGTMRLCVDLRPLNARVAKQKYPFPLIEDCIARIGDKSVFSLLDLKDGFHQIKVHPEHTKYFAFATPDGQYEYTRLPFGYCEAPAEFQKRIVQILQPLIRKDKVIVYIDDILIASETVEENIETLNEVLSILREYNFELNYRKSLFLRKRIEYLGYVISHNSITLSDRHTDAVRKFPLPKDVASVQRFLGLSNYFRKFIKDYSIKARPLYELLKKTVPFVMNEKCLQSFEILKRELTSYPALALYNPTAETELHTDASAQGLAAILLQKQKSGIWAPVAYYSQGTNAAEAKYHSFELEMLAIVKAVERFHMYLYGIDFGIVTDCNALVYAVNKANLNPRIARWTLKLQNYKFKLMHRAGKRMAHVDALSRHVYRRVAVRTRARIQSTTRSKTEGYRRESRVQ